MPGLVSIVYDYAEFQLATATTDYDVKANVAALFDNIKVARSVLIQSDQTISFKFNNTIMPAITMIIGEGPYQLPKNFLHIVNFYITNNSGNTANIKVTLA